MRPDLHAYTAPVLKNRDCPAVLINSMDDHPHLLFRLHLAVVPSTAVGNLKAASSKWIKTK